MRVKVSIGFVAVCAALALAGCGNREVIGSTPPPQPTATPGGITNEYAITAAAGQPTDITMGADGNLYTTLFNLSEVTEYNLSTGIFTLFAATTKPAGPTGITLGPDNDIWFTETTSNKVATIALAKVKEFDVTPGASPAYIAGGPNQSLYFTEPGLNAIGAITTFSDIVSGPFVIPTANADPLGIVVGPDNNMWFTEYNAAKIGRFNPVTLTVDKEIALPAGSVNPTDIRQGPDGALWFTENNPAGPKIGRLALSTSSITEYPLTGAGSATGLAVALDNNFYFADAKNNAIGQFNVNTQKTAEFKIPTPNAVPTAVSLGGDGRIYFTERAANKIGQLSYF